METAAPLKLIEMAAPTEWMDYNGHMNIAHYTTAVDQAMDRFLSDGNLGKEYMEQEGGSMFVIQQQFHYMMEIREGEVFEVTAQVLDVDEKRFHIFLRIQKPGSGEKFATSEIVAIHVDMATRKAAPMPDSARQWVGVKKAQHQTLPQPRLAGHKIGLE